MVKVNRINVSQVEGGYSDDIDKRPNGEMALYNDDNNGFDLVIHDGVNSTNLNKVLGKGRFYGHNADSADGNGYDTIKLIPDIPSFNNGSHQYLVIDPTAPNHIHVRAGGTIDDSNSELIIGGENSYLKVGAGTNPEISILSNNNNWIFGTDGSLTVPGAVQNGGSFEIKAGTAINSVEFLGQIDNGFGDAPGATLHVTSIINGTITDGMTIYGEGLPAEGWVLQFGTVMAPQGDGGIGNYYLPGANYLIGSQTFNSGNGNKTWTFDTNGNINLPNSGNIALYNGSTLAQGTFNNMTGGNGGISLNCVVGYELNWQGGRLKNTYNNGETAVNIVCDSAIEISGSGIDNMEINSSGVIFSDGTIQTTAFNGEASVVKTSVFNETGSNISKFSVVYIDGGHGDLPTINLAIASGEMTSSKTYGITAENIDNMSTGSVVVLGALTGLDTDQFNPTAPSGDVNGITLWLSPITPGEVTTTKPSAPNHAVSVGTIVRTHQNEGVIEVRIQNGYEIEELHNVKVSGVSHHDVLVYNSGTSLWENNNSVVFSNPSGITGATAVMNIVQISQSDYNNIVSPDPNTLYVIND